MIEDRRLNREAISVDDKETQLKNITDRNFREVCAETAPPSGAKLARLRAARGKDEAVVVQSNFGPERTDA